MHEQGRYPGYQGDRLYEVRHPDYKEAVYVAAADSTSALVVAADVWQRKWTELRFYSYCYVRRIN